MSISQERKGKNISRSIPKVYRSMISVSRHKYMARMQKFRLGKESISYTKRRQISNILNQDEIANLDFNHLLFLFSRKIGRSDPLMRMDFRGLGRNSYWLSATFSFQLMEAQLWLLSYQVQMTAVNKIIIIITGKKDNSCKFGQVEIRYEFLAATAACWKEQAFRKGGK